VALRYYNNIVYITISR